MPRGLRPTRVLSRLALLVAAATALLAAAIAAVFMAVFGLENRPGGQADCAPASPADATALDAWMRSTLPESPLVGLGVAFVRAGEAGGIDPRALVAIAYHESKLGTLGQLGWDSQPGPIQNPFGWGPGIRFGSWEEGIMTVATSLGRRYIARGNDTLAEVQPIWAPIGASNDPTGLNRNWLPGVSATYRELGGDPDGSIALAPGQVALPVDSQATAPTAQAGAATQDGGDGRAPLSVNGFVFPVLGANHYSDDYLSPRGTGSHCHGTTFHCATDVMAATGTPIVAPIDGVIVRMSSSGLGGNHLSIEGGGERFYLAHLDAFAPGMRDGLAVTAGQPVGTVGTDRQRPGHRAAPAHRLVAPARRGVDHRQPLLPAQGRRGRRPDQRRRLPAHRAATSSPPATSTPAAATSCAPPSGTCSGCPTSAT